MKKFILLSFGLSISFFLAAQNVGIGTSSPNSKLTIEGLEAGFNGTAAGLQFNNTAPGGGSWYLRAGATGTSTPPGGFSIGNNTDYVFAFNNAGLLGLLSIDPQERLHIGQGNIRLDLSEKGIILNDYAGPFITRKYDPFTSGAYSGLGRWGLFMEPNRLTLGIPNISGKAFQVSKYELNGTPTALFGVDVNGALQLNGSSGTAGQVLTSNGSGAAQWQTKTSSSDNNVRFEVSFQESVTNAFSPPLTYTSFYNYNTAAVTISSGGVTINLPGLYHIEGYYETSYTFSGAPAVFSQTFISNMGRAFVESTLQPALRNPGSASFTYNTYGKFSREVYIPSTATVSCGFTNVYTSGGVTLSNSFHRGRISGYLISQ